MISRGTTPTFIFNTPQGIDLTQAAKVYVTFSDLHEKELMTKEDTDLTITSTSVSVYLTQAESLSLPNGKIKVQLNWLYQEGNKVKRATSQKRTISADRNLLDKELTL